MSKTLNHLHFWPSLICMNIIFFPMLVQGMAGFHRRWYNGGDAYLAKAADSANVFGNTVVAEHRHEHPRCRWVPGPWRLFQIPFIINLFISWKFGKKVEQRQSMGCHHPGVGDADASGPRQLPQGSRDLSRPLRIQPPGL